MGGVRTCWLRRVRWIAKAAEMVEGFIQVFLLRITWMPVQFEDRAGCASMSIEVSIVLFDLTDGGGPPPSAWWALKKPMLIGTVTIL